MAWKKIRKIKMVQPPRFEHAFLWQYSLLQQHFVANTPVATNISGTITTNTVAP